MTKASAAPSRMTPSRRTRLVATAASGCMRAPGERGGLGRGLEGEQDRRMAGGERPRRRQYFEARPVAGIVAAAGEEGGKGVTRAGQLLDRTADRMGPHQRRRRLAERAGAHFLAELGDPAVRIEPEIDHDSAAADRRA